MNLQDMAGQNLGNFNFYGDDQGDFANDVDVDGNMLDDRFIDFLNEHESLPTVSTTGFVYHLDQRAEQPSAITRFEPPLNNLNTIDNQLQTTSIFDTPTQSQGRLVTTSVVPYSQQLQLGLSSPLRHVDSQIPTRRPVVLTNTTSQMPGCIPSVCEYFQGPIAPQLKQNACFPQSVMSPIVSYNLSAHTATSTNILPLVHNWPRLSPNVTDNINLQQIVYNEGCQEAVSGTIENCISPDITAFEDPYTFPSSVRSNNDSSGPPSNLTETNSLTSTYYDSPASNPECSNGSVLHVNSLVAGDVNVTERWFSSTGPSRTDRAECSPLVKEGYYSTGEFKIVVKNPKAFYDKVQRRIGNESQQRIQGGMVDTAINSTHPVSKVEAFVRRDPRIAAKAKDTNGKVLLRSQEYEKMTCINATCEFRLDLDDKYTVGENNETRLVYKLAQNKTKELNKFQLLLDLEFHDVPDKVENVILFDFLLKSQVTGCAGKGVKRPRLGNGRERDLENVEKLAIDHLSAKVATFDKIVGRDFQTSTTKGDIGYFFRIHDRRISRKFKEGDVIVFVVGKDGETAIELLTSDNLSEAVLAGVITRKAYVQARRPGDWLDDDDHSEEYDIVCVIGMVPVMIKGEVQNGERIYTSEEEGTAVAESQLEGDDDSQPIWLGFAMQSNTEKSGKLVDCFVSILLGMADQKIEAVTRVFRKKLIKRLDGLEDVVQELEQGHRDLEESVNDIRRSNRGCKIKVFVALFMVVLIGIIGYIFFAPSSPYVKAKCREGSLKSILSFEFIPEADDVIPITGLEFKWSVLRKKLDLQFDEMENGTDIRYFMNKYRCETGQIRRVTSWLDPSPQLPRNNVLAVNKKCTKVYYFSKKENKWYDYKENEISHITCTS